MCILGASDFTFVIFSSFNSSCFGVLFAGCDFCTCPMVLVHLHCSLSPRHPESPDFAKIGRRTKSVQTRDALVCLPLLLFFFLCLLLLLFCCLSLWPPSQKVSRCFPLQCWYAISICSAGFAMLAVRSPGRRKPRHHKI